MVSVREKALIPGETDLGEGPIKLAGWPSFVLWSQKSRAGIRPCGGEERRGNDNGGAFPRLNPVPESAGRRDQAACL